MAPHRSTAWPLTWVAIALVAYATLYPWSGWHWPDSQVFSWVLPRLPHEVMNDLMSNILGYAPLGLIMAVAHLRSGRAPWLAAVLTVLSCSAVSYTLELIQYTIPQRVPSRTDWILNTLGGAWGVLGALTLHALGLLDAWHRLRERWFIPQASAGLALMGLWPLGLLYPPPLPLAQGQIWPPLRLTLIEWTQDTPLQDWLVPDDPLALWGDAVPHGWAWLTEHATLMETLVVALGMLAPMCVACALARPRGLRVFLMAAAVLLAMGFSALSTAMNFGPQHALTWLTLSTSVGLSIGAMGGALLVGRGRRFCALLGAAVVLALVGLIHLLPPDPYYAQTLQHWSHGRFIRFHGLSRWFGLLWPYVALLWLLSRGLRPREAHAPSAAQTTA